MQLVIKKSMAVILSWLCLSWLCVSAESKPIFIDLTDPHRGHRMHSTTPTSHLVAHSSVEKLLYPIAQSFNIDPLLIMAIIKTESNFQAHAVSPKGAVGLMQVMPSTAAQYGPYNLYSPADNIHVGTKHLAYLLNRYQSIPLALAAYNAGEGNVNKYQDIPPFKETRQYVHTVMSGYHSAMQANTVSPTHTTALPVNSSQAEPPSSAIGSVRLIQLQQGTHSQRGTP